MQIGYIEKNLVKNMGNVLNCGSYVNTSALNLKAFLIHLVVTFRAFGFRPH